MFVIMTDILTMIVLGVASTLSVSVVALGVAAKIRTVSKRAKRMSHRLPSGTSSHHANNNKGCIEFHVKCCASK